MTDQQCCGKDQRRRRTRERGLRSEQACARCQYVAHTNEASSAAGGDDGYPGRRAGCGTDGPRGGVNLAGSARDLSVTTAVLGPDDSTSASGTAASSHHALGPTKDVGSSPSTLAVLTPAVATSTREASNDRIELVKTTRRDQAVRDGEFACVVSEPDAPHSCVSATLMAEIPPRGARRSRSCGTLRPDTGEGRLTHRRALRRRAPARSGASAARTTISACSSATPLCAALTPDEGRRWRPRSG